MSNNNHQPTKRLLKVYYQYYPMRFSKTLKPYPVIRIGGLYLEAFNFKIGDPIEVIYEEGKISIQKLMPPSTKAARKA